MDEIQRLYMIDLELGGFDTDATEEATLEVARELATGLLVTPIVLIPAIIEGLQVNEYPVVRFSGPRNQLEELVNRYRGVSDAFAPSTHNPDGDRA